MGPYTIRRLIMVVCVTAVGVIPVVNATESEANSPHKKHYKLKKPGLNSRASREIRPVAGPRFAQPSFERGYVGVCPAVSHGGYECKIWPPPVDVDPDRRSR